MKKIFRILLALVLVAWMAGLAYSSMSSYNAQASAPNPTPKPGTVFSPKNYNKKKRGGILAILDWFRGGGGGPLMYCEEGDWNSIRFEKMNGWKFTDTFELMDGTTILGCNWPAGEQLLLTIRYPNGKMIVQNMPVQVMGGDRGGIYYDFRPSLDDPSGKYFVTIEGNSGTASGNLNFVRQTGMDVFWLGNNRLLLLGFAPSETVQVVAYDSNNQFQGWNEYQVGKDGSLMLPIELPPGYFILVSSLNKGIDLGLQIPHNGMEKAVELCTQALKPRLRTNAWAAALENITYYALPDSKSKVIRQMQTQSQHYVAQGPWCAEGKWWWKMESKKGFSGYVAEADRAKYYLIPVE
jgi:hypothetical protein